MNRIVGGFFFSAAIVPFLLHLTRPELTETQLFLQFWDLFVCVAMMVGYGTWLLVKEEKM